MPWKPKAKMWNWRSCLTAEEATTIKASDEMLRQIEKMRSEHHKTFASKRMKIVNRALQRAKYQTVTPEKR